MARSGTRDHGAFPRHRSTIVQPKVSQADLQSLLAAACLYNQPRPTAVGAELGTDSEDLSGVVELQNRISELSLSPEQVLDLVAQRAMTMTNASGAAIAIAEAGAVICRSRAGSTAPALGAHLDPQSGFSGACLRSGNVLYCDDTEIDARVNLAACRQLDSRSILAVPIRREQRVIGILEVFSGWVGAFSRGQAKPLQLLADLVSDAIRTSKLRTADSAQPLGFSSTERAVTPLPHARPLSPEKIERLSIRPAVAVVRLDTLQKYAQERRSLLSGRVLLFAALASAGLMAILLGRAIHAVVPMQSSPTAVTQPSGPSPSLPVSTADDGPPAVISAIRFHSRPEFSSIALELSSPVKYESGRLHDPERVYFDLVNTRAAAGLVSSSRAVASDDHFVLRVRLAPKEGGVTRVVIDLNCSCDYLSVMSSFPPYRLMIEVQPATLAVDAAPPATLRPTASSERTVSGPSRGLADEANQVSGPMHIRIVIDPGHGGTDRGTVGPSGLEEKDLVLDVGQRLGRLASDRLGAEVIYTRTDDYFVPLEGRSALANSVRADLFMSIHANASDSRSVRGVETFYMDPRSATQGSLLTVDGHSSGDPYARAAKTEASRQLAAAVQHAVYTRLAATNPELRNRGVKAAPLVVLVGPNMPSILSEISFMSSPTEERKLKDANYREHIAEALYRGITTYLSRTRTQKPYGLDRASVDHVDESRLHLGERRVISK